MAFFAIGTKLHVQYQMLCNNQIMRNNIYYECSEAGTELTLDGAYAAISDALDGNPATNYVVGKLRDCMSTSSVIKWIRYQAIAPIRYRAYLVQTNIVGTRQGDATAQNLQASITKQTDLSGRRYVGALRVGGLSSNDYANGFLNVGLKTALAALKDACLLNLATAGAGAWFPIVLHRANPIVQSTGTYMSRMLIQDTLRTQRSRTVGHGE